jgi:hypothetical protein
VIQIPNLSPLEMELADALWACETREDVKQFIAALPTKFMRAKAIGLYHLMLIESIDEAMDPEDLSLANEVIGMVK